MLRYTKYNVSMILNLGYTYITSQFTTIDIKSYYLLFNYWLNGAIRFRFA